MTDLYDFGSEYAQTYTAVCPRCAAEVEVSAQRDEDPEYYTEVHVRCPCGGSVSFSLPVN
jgi:hypothetical protein